MVYPYPNPNFAFTTVAVPLNMSVCVAWLLSLRLAKFDSDKTKIHGFRENLKSTGQSKFTLDEKEETGVGQVTRPRTHTSFSVIHKSTVDC